MKSTLFRSLILIGLLPLSWQAQAETFTGRIPTDHRLLLKNPAYIISANRMFDIEAAKLATIGLKLLPAASLNSNLSAASFEQAMFLPARDAAREVDGYSFELDPNNNGFRVTVSMITTGASFAIPEASPFIKLVDPLISLTASKAMDREGKLGKLDPELVLAINTRILVEASDPNSAYGKLLKPFVIKYFGFDPSNGRLYRGEALTGMRLAALEEDKMNKAEKKQFKQVQQAHSIQDLQNDVLEEGTKELSEKGKSLVEQQRLIFIEFLKDQKIKRDEAEGRAALGLAGHMSRLAGNNKLAEMFYGMGRINAALKMMDEENAKLYKPSKIIGIYNSVTLGVMCLDLFQQLSEGPAPDIAVNRHKELMQALIQISQQIDSLRRNLEERLDLIEANQYSFFQLTWASNNDIRASIKTMTSVLNSLNEKMKNHIGRVDSAVKGLGDMQIVDLLTVCLPRYSPQDKIQPLDSLEKFRKCRNHFAALASGLYVDSVNSEFLELISSKTKGELGQNSVWSAQLFTQQTGIKVSANFGHPGQWVTGVMLLTQLFNANPKFKAAFESSGIAGLDSSLHLEALLERGKKMQEALENLALYSPGHLKRDSFFNKFNEYIRFADALIEKDLEIKEQTYMQGPRTSLGIEEPLPIEDNAFVRQRIQLCKDVKPRLIKYGGNGFNPNSSMGGQLVASWQTNVENYFKNHEFRLSPQFISLFPASVQWMQRMNYREAKLSVCFSQIDYDEWFWNADETWAMKYTFAIQLHMDIKEGNQAVRVQVGEYKGSGNYMVMFNSGITNFFFWDFWMGSNRRWVEIANKFPVTYGKGNFPGVLQKPTYFLKEVTSVADLKVRQRYENQFKAHLDNLKIDVQNRSQLESQHQRLNVNKKLDELIFISRWGLNTKNADVSGWLDWLIKQQGLPDANEIVALLDKHANIKESLKSLLTERKEKAEEYILAIDKNPDALYAPKNEIDFTYKSLSGFRRK